jgi:hypothetical protein
MIGSSTSHDYDSTSAVATTSSQPARLDMAESGIMHILLTPSTGPRVH